MHERGDLAGELALWVTLLRFRNAGRLELRDPWRVEEREELQVPTRVAIIGVEPELVELVRRREIRIQPDRPCLGLAELRPGCGRDQRHDDAVRFAAAYASNQVHPGD